MSRRSAFLGLVSLVALLTVGVILALRTRPSPRVAVTIPDLAGSPIVALQLDPDVDQSMKSLSRNDTEYFHSWKVLRQTTLSAVNAELFRSLLAAPESYGGTGEKCFEPEWAFKIGASTDVLVSLKCRRVQVVQNHAAQMLTLSTAGAGDLGELVAKLVSKTPEK